MTALEVMWLVSSYPWSDNPSVGIFHGTATRALVRAGVGVTVVAPTPMAPWPLPLLRERWRLHASAPRRQTDAGVRVVRPRYPAVPGEPDWAGVDRLMARAARRARAGSWNDARLIHAHFAAPGGMAAWHLSRSTGLPYLVTLHGGDVTEWPDGHPRLLPAYRRALQGAARVVAVSRALADDARRIADVEPIVIPIGVDLDRFTETFDRGEARRALGVADDEIVMLMVARLIPRKRVRELVDAIHLIGHPFRAIFAGSGPEQGYRAQPGIVDYIGEQSNADVPRLMAGADLTVLPSAREGLPTALVEAGAARVPVIASRAGGTPELLADDRGVLLDETTADAIAEAMRAFAADRPAAAARAVRLHDHVLAEYDADAGAQRLAQLYAEVLGEPTE